MEAVGLFAGGVAHDLNNILSGILGYSSYLMSKAPPDSSLHRDLGLIHESGVRAAELMRQLFVIAHRRHFARELLSINEIVQETLAGLKLAIPERVEVELDLGAGLPPVPGDRAMIQQALTNLCVRAVDAMTDQKGKLTVVTEHRTLEPAEREVFAKASGGGYVIVTVSDTGPSLSAEMRLRVFDPYFKTGSSATKTGLSLAVVYGVASNHDGGVIVESGESAGTRFKLLLPLEVAEHKAGPAPAAPAAGTETVLVVDDEPKVRQMVGQVLKLQGYKVLAAASGEDAVKALKTGGMGIDLVLLDLLMPGMGGEAAFHALREISGDVNVLVTSVTAQESTGQRLIREGARGMILKPYTSDTLLTAVREALNRKAQ